MIKTHVKKTIVKCLPKSIFVKLQKIRIKRLIETEKNANSVLIARKLASIIRGLRYNDSIDESEYTFVVEDLKCKYPNDAYILYYYADHLVSVGQFRTGFRYYQQSNHQMHADLRKTGAPSILMATLPRSGTGSLCRFIDKYYGHSAIDLKNYEVDSNAMATQLHWPEWAFEPQYPCSGYTARHFTLDENNLKVVNHCFDKVIVNLRNPLQNMLSWIHYMAYFKFTRNADGLMGARLPENFFAMTISEKIDWMIGDGFLEDVVNWIELWLSAEVDPEFKTQILFTTFEELTGKNSAKSYKKIVDFIDARSSKSIVESVHQPDFSGNHTSHFRSGKKDEYLHVFSKSQIEIASEKIPHHIASRFNWSFNSVITPSASLQG